MVVTATYHRIGRFNGVLSASPSSLFTAVFASRSEEHTSELQSPCNLVCRIIRSEEHTSELQSPCNLVCRLLLEKKKKIKLQSHCNQVSSLLVHTNEKSVGQRQSPSCISLPDTT